MTDTTSLLQWKPLSLRAQKGNSAVKVGEVIRNGEAHRVAVSRLEDGRTYRVRVRISDKGGFRDAGTVTGSGRNWHLRSFDADSQTRSSGYSETGPLADQVERVVQAFLSSVEYAAAEAAKSPEQREAEKRAKEAARKAAVEERTRKAAMKALDEYFRALGIEGATDLTLQTGLDAAVAAVTRKEA